MILMCKKNKVHIFIEKIHSQRNGTFILKASQHATASFAKCCKLYSTLITLFTADIERNNTDSTITFEPQLLTIGFQ